jgi:hypothetical protein
MYTDCHVVSEKVMVTRDKLFRQKAKVQAPEGSSIPTGCWW